MSDIKFGRICSIYLANGLRQGKEFIAFDFDFIS